ncbi:MAG TPA: FAD-binding oxidoreductase [Blastocatellia bacterium]
MANPALDRLLESIVGSHNITRQPDLAIDSLKPQLLIRPASSEEVAECLRACDEHQAAVVPAGKMNWLEYGNPLRRADVVLSLERISRVIEYSAPDLTATIEAGMLLADFNALVRKERQWLPLDPPGASRASVGALFACASSGPLRAGFGTPRDYALGLKLAHPDGSESRSGGKVVKNVAGYDMNKLYVGSFGTLAVITEITVKLRPLPERISTLVVTDRDHQKLISVARAASELQPVSIFLCSLPEISLAIRFAGSEPTVRYQIDCVVKALDSQATILDENEDRNFWTRVADIDRTANVAVKASVPIACAAQGFEKMLSLSHTSIAADLGTGIIRTAFDADEQSAVSMIEKLRAETILMGGTLVIERAPVSVRRLSDAWGDLGQIAMLMKSIKEKFDPHSMLNPGKFVAGL